MLTEIHRQIIAVYGDTMTQQTVSKGYYEFSERLMLMMNKETVRRIYSLKTLFTKLKKVFIQIGVW